MQSRGLLCIREGFLIVPGNPRLKNYSINCLYLFPIFYAVCLAALFSKETEQLTVENLYFITNTCSFSPNFWYNGNHKIAAILRCTWLYTIQNTNTNTHVTIQELCSACCSAGMEEHKDKLILSRSLISQFVIEFCINRLVFAEKVLLNGLYD